MTRSAGKSTLARVPGLISRAVGDDFVIIDPRTQTAHSLSGAHASVWRALEDSTTMPAVDVDAVAADLRDLGLLVGTEPGLDRRTVLRRAGVAGGLVVAANAATVVVPGGIASLVLPNAAALGSTVISTYTYTATTGATGGNWITTVPANCRLIEFSIAGGGGAARGYAEGGDGALISGQIYRTDFGLIAPSAANVGGIVGSGALVGATAAPGGQGPGGFANAAAASGGGGTSFRVGATGTGGATGTLVSIAGGGGGAGTANQAGAGRGGNGGTDGANGTGGDGPGGKTGQNISTLTAGAPTTGLGGAAGALTDGAAGATSALGGGGGAGGTVGGQGVGGSGGGGYTGGGGGSQSTTRGGGGGGGGNYTGGANNYVTTITATSAAANGGTSSGDGSAFTGGTRGTVSLTFKT